jgi:V8-like Glu-specific endopeptidase
MKRLAGYAIVFLLFGCAKEEVPQQSADSGKADSPKEQTLASYSLEQLREALTARRNKTTYAAKQSAGLEKIADSSLIAEIIFREKTIYGSDRRIEYHEIQNPLRLAAADSVAAIVDPDHFAESDERFTLIGRSLEAQYHFCSGEAFLTEQVVAMCTAFVVGDDVIATAGHCVDSFQSKRLVFGYRATKNNAGESSIPLEIPKSEVYQLKSLVAHMYEEKGRDFALVKVDRPIANHRRLDLDMANPVRVEDPVYVIGYPLGLPLKLADHAYVRQVSIAKGYFDSNLDTFGGNSGSPVLNALSNKVVGILVRGDADYESNGSCNKAVVCPDTGCSGESATLVAAFSTSVPKNTAQAEATEPIVKTFDSGPKLSGTRKSFSESYVVQSDPPPPGFKIGTYSYSLTGDRQCNSWSTCVAGISGDRVVFSFSLQGHDEWQGSGQAQSEGHLVVTYSPSSKPTDLELKPATYTIYPYGQTLQGGVFVKRQIPGCSCGIGPHSFRPAMDVVPSVIRTKVGDPVTINYDASMICQKQTIRDLSGREHGPSTSVGELVLGHAQWDKDVVQDLPLEWGIITYPGYAKAGPHQISLDVRVECADRPGNNFCPDSGFNVCEALAVVPVEVVQ